MNIFCHRDRIIKEVLMDTKTKYKIVLKDKERQECEVWTRVMGYHRPVSSFNLGKKGEYEERKWFVESELDDVKVCC
jgi:anaerobic ribonucleoside-triphosphate reductase